MKRLYELARRVAAGRLSVLVLGETGVGKDVLASYLHTMSPRAGKQLVRLNCGALPENLVESELFGYEKGAFTGATGEKPGLLEVADGGSVFLDEVGELSPPTQVKLLRVIEDQQVLRVGGLKPRKLDVRFIAATNRNLEAEIAHGKFRQDLYFRLNGITLVIPPLRERPVEIEAYVREFLVEAAAAAGLSTPPRLSRAAAEMLRRYSWPGNIRELKSVIERAVLLCDGGVILPEHLPGEKMVATVGVAGGPPAPTSPEEPAPTVPGPAADEYHRIVDALNQAAGSQTLAAKLLGISRRTLVTRLDEYGIPRPRKGRGLR